jgi:thiamine-phosphate pyrophosphorylase
MRLVLPRLYVILDLELLTLPAKACAQELGGAGVRLLQYRHKSASARELLANAGELARALVPLGVSFLVNDRPEVAFLAGASGVHVGQEDLDVEQARALVGREKWVGISTHNLQQFQTAAATSADYIAVGPIFATASKAHGDPVVGVEFIRRVRPLTAKPIVAIGGITLERAASVVEAGADSVAVISEIMRAADPAERARQYLAILNAADHAAAV